MNIEHSSNSDIRNNLYNSKEWFKSTQSTKHSNFHEYTLNGKKSLTFPCDEGIFLSVFKDNTRRYPPVR
ncbi:16788_t:CDS:2, partial [Entrophospora sp. SA101]